MTALRLDDRLQWIYRSVGFNTEKMSELRMLFAWGVYVELPFVGSTIVLMSCAMTVIKENF
jgi:hypothetical protein